MFCPKCGAEVDNGAKFCPKCGNRLKETKSTDSLIRNIKVPNLAKTKGNGKILLKFAVPAVLIVLILVGILSGGSSNKPRGKYVLENPFTGGEAASITIKGNSYTNVNTVWGFTDKGVIKEVEKWDDCIHYSVELEGGGTYEFWYWIKEKAIETQGGEWYYKK